MLLRPEGAVKPLLRTRGLADRPPPGGSGAAAKAIGQDSNPGFHRILRYYEALLGGQSPYAVAMSFESRPRLWGFTVDDAPAEYSFKIADHPTIVIYRRTTSAP